MGAWTIVFAIAVSYFWGVLHLPGWLLNILIIVGGVVIARIFFNKAAKKQ